MRSSAVAVFALAAIAASSCKKKKEKQEEHEPADDTADDGWTEPTEADNALYPTMESAGTKEIFLLEEPDRGTHITQIEVPEEGKTVMTEAFCELEEHGVTCVAGAGPFRVRQAGATEVVELLGPAGVMETFVGERGEDGSLQRLAHLDQRGALEWVRTYEDGGTRYSARLLSGGNALEGCGSMQLALDGQKRVKSATCLQWGGKPMLDATGVARRDFTRDDRGLITRVEFLGLDSENVARPDGVHAIDYQRSKDGAVEKTTYSGLDGKVVVSRDGCAMVAERRDDNGLEIEARCLGVDGQPRAGVGGVAREALTRDERGCVVRRDYFDAQGKPHRPPFTGEVQRYEVNDDCTPLSEACFSAEGKSIACDAAVARLVFGLDDKGRRISTKYFDKDGNPTGSPSLGAHEHRFIYDEFDRATEEACFDAKGQPILCSGTGVHAFVTAYDSAGRSVEVRFLDATRSPTTNLGSFVSRSTYDNYDHLSEVRKEGPNGALESTRGMSRMRYLYDPSHRLFGLLLLQDDGSPASYDACFTNLDCPVLPWHAVRVIYKEGDLESNIFFDQERKAIATIDCDTSHCLGAE